MTGTRVACYGECGECGHRQKLSIDPRDTNGEIEIGCPECGESTRHETGGMKFA